ncbi:MAG: UPF0149 family protein [Gammaproteobacteria bacterium]|nr:UPF0149 family protein [Gammaproteobacteria bacterium]
MKDKLSPHYNDVSDILNQTTLKLHPSQVHGLICGILCGDPHADHPAWQTLVAGEEASPQTHQVLQKLYDMSAHELQEFLLEFQLLLPDEEENLRERAEALTLWCQGFLTGLKIADVKIIGREASDATEAINDIIEIAKMNYEDVVASEEDEVAFTELIEYVRMAIILLYQDLHESSVQAEALDTNKHLH